MKCPREGCHGDLYPFADGFNCLLCERHFIDVHAITVKISADPDYIESHRQDIISSLLRFGFGHVYEVYGLSKDQLLPTLEKWCNADERAILKRLGCVIKTKRRRGAPLGNRNNRHCKKVLV